MARRSARWTAGILTALLAWPAIAGEPREAKEDADARFAERLEMMERRIQELERRLGKQREGQDNAVNDAMEAFRDVMRERLGRERFQFEPRAGVGGGFGLPDNSSWLGVYMDDGRDKARGVAVARVVPGSPAERAGIRKGDVIVRAGGRRVERPASLSAAVRRHKPGEQVALTVVRDGVEIEILVTLGRNPAPLAGGAVRLWDRNLGDVRIERHDGPLGAWQFTRAGKSRSVATVAVAKGRRTVTVRLEGTTLSLTGALRQDYKLSEAQAERLGDALNTQRRKIDGMLREIANRAANEGRAAPTDAQRQLDDFHDRLEGEIRRALNGLPADRIDDVVAALTNHTIAVETRVRPKTPARRAPRPEVQGEEQF